MADRSIKRPVGIIEDVPLKVGKFFIPVDFVVLDMEEDKHTPIILGRPFLATAGTIIDMKVGKLIFNIGDETVEFKILSNVQISSPLNSCYKIDILDRFEEMKPNKNKHDEKIPQVESWRDKMCSTSYLGKPVSSHKFYFWLFLDKFKFKGTNQFKISKANQSKKKK